MKKDAGKKIVAERVEEFERNKAVLTKKGHGETNIRSNYIDLLFHALGWDMKSHYEVVREFSQRDKSTESGTKKVDYAFKINGKLKFFIEAKEASIDLEKDKSSIFQAKRYAYSSNGKAPIVILTDFEELRVFNVIKAPLMDNTDRELLKSHSMKYTEYLDKWDLLWDTFSKEAVENGSLDKLRGKIDKNTKTMDIDFLEQITEWRELLAKNIANRNKDLTVDEINEAVQRILDRLVFIRNLEDREIEPENTLLDKTKKSENIYKSIVPVFNALDKTYNGLLFKKHFSENIEIDDKTIKDIIRNMSYPVSPFQFDVIEPEILGRIYEKFLGSKIRLTPNHQAKIEEKIEVRKAGGVYYTPEYIVEYIVANTVGKKIEGLTPEEIKKIKIVDPACGSGSFLIGAYAYILDYHQKWYSTNQKNKTFLADWYKTKDGEIKVSLDKRGDILRNNIFGVDIDKEATEVAIMSLYLKMLDDGFDKGERDLFFIKGSILPDMINNVKCGNSLVSTDYCDDILKFEISELKIIKPFSWANEFIEIFKGRHGFDIVIGNPPYAYRNSTEELLRDYYLKTYESAEGNFELYKFFIENNLKICNNDGFTGIIVSASFLVQASFEKLRKFILKSSSIVELSPLGPGVFDTATVDTTILITQNKKIDDNKIKIKTPENPTEISENIEYYISQNRFQKNNNSLFDYKLSDNEAKITDKIFNNFPVIETGFEFGVGINTGYIKDKLVSDSQKDSSYHPMVPGTGISRYGSVNTKGWIMYDTDFVKKQGKLGRTLPAEYLLSSQKILVVRTRNLSIKRRIVATIDNDSCYNLNRLSNIVAKDNYNLYGLLGILNSNLFNWLFTTRFYDYEIKPVYLRNCPLANCNDEILVQLSKQIHECTINLEKIKSENEKSILQRQLLLLEKKIDEKVYELYGLTKDEITIINNR